MVPLSVGTDTVGSVRVRSHSLRDRRPQACARDDQQRLYPLAPGLDHVGLFAATVDDVETPYQALADQPPNTSAGDPISVALFRRTASR